MCRLLTSKTHDCLFFFFCVVHFFGISQVSSIFLFSIVKWPSPSSAVIVWGGACHGKVSTSHAAHMQKIAGCSTRDNDMHVAVTTAFDSENIENGSWMSMTKLVLMCMGLHLRTTVTVPSRHYFTLPQRIYERFAVWLWSRKIDHLFQRKKDTCCVDLWCFF